MNISEEAVEAAWEQARDDADGYPYPERDEIRRILEAAAPHMLSHEREQTRLAHLDATVNRETKQAELAAVWDAGWEAASEWSCYIEMGGDEPDCANPYGSES